MKNLFKSISILIIVIILIFVQIQGSKMAYKKIVYLKDDLYEQGTLILNKIKDVFGYRILKLLEIPYSTEAKGDGITDDTSVMNKELSIIGSKGGGVFKLGKRKIYLITSSLNVPSNVTINGNGSTILAKISLSTLIGTNVERRKAAINIIGEFTEQAYTSTAGEFIAQRPMALVETTIESNTTNKVILQKSSDAANLNVGDTVRLCLGWRIPRPVISEYFKIASIKGTTITFTRNIINRYDCSLNSIFRDLYNKDPDTSLPFNGINYPDMSTYAYFGLQKVKTVKNVQIKNLIIKKYNQSSYSVGNQGVYILGAENTLIQNVKFINCTLWNLDSQNTIEKNNQYIGDGLNTIPLNYVSNGSNLYNQFNNQYINQSISVEEGAVNSTIFNPLIKCGGEIPIWIVNYVSNIKVKSGELVSQDSTCVIIEKTFGNITVEDINAYGNASCISIKPHLLTGFRTNLKVKNNNLSAMQTTVITLTAGKSLGTVVGEIRDNTLLNGDVICDDWSKFHDLKVINYIK